jgi:hypothetical protein
MFTQAGRFRHLDTTVASRLPVIFEGRQIGIVRAQMEVAPLLALDTASGYNVAEAEAAVAAIGSRSLGSRRPRRP